MDTTSGAPVTELRSGGSAPRPATDEARPNPGAATAEGSAADTDDSPTPLSVTVDSLHHRFDELDVIEELSLGVAAGEVLGIVGPSGGGKTTLLELVAGLLEPSAGTIEIGAVSSQSDRLARCAYMPQRDLLLPWLRAIDNAAIALRNRGLGRTEARAAALPLFERFGLAGFESARPGELSGGMRQRVAFLRTLLAGKPVLLLDEPFGALDAITRGEMQEWLASTLSTEPRTVVLVTHDVEEALYVCDRIVVLGPRPATAIAELATARPRAVPRVDAITGSEFISVREQALERLAEGTR